MDEYSHDVFRKELRNMDGGTQSVFKVFEALRTIEYVFPRAEIYTGLSVGSAKDYAKLEFDRRCNDDEYSSDKEMPH